MIKKPCVAIVGIGKWGKNILNSLSRKDIDIKYCVHSGSNTSSNWLRENYPKIIDTDHYDMVLADTGVSSVFIATPIHTHFDLAMKALRSNKNVFLEKPASGNIEDIRTLTQEATNRNLIFGVGYIFVYHPILSEIKHLVGPKDIKGIYFEWNKWGTFGESIDLNLLTHEISILKTLDLEIDYKSVIFTQLNNLVQLSAKSATGVDISIYINRLSSDKRKSITIITTEGTYVWLNNELRKSLDESSPEILLTSTGNTLDLELDYFLDCIKTKKTPIVDGIFSEDIITTLLHLKDVKPR